MISTEEVNFIGAQAAAYQLTKLFAITSPKDIVLEDIAMARGVLVLDAPLQGADARLIRKGKNGVIRVNSSLRGGKRRFAIAHELGHWELHEGISQLALCSEQDMELLKSYNNSKVELEASAFASELLMPPKLFRPRCEEAEPDLRLIQLLSEEFDTTLTTTALRFVEECAQACMVIFSHDGRVSWWKRNRKASNFWIGSDQEIQKESLAWDCLYGIPPSLVPERVPTEAWFQDKYYRRNIEIFEQSMRLGRHPAVLSLLSLVEGENEDE